MEYRRSYPTAVEVASEMRRLTSHVHQFEARERDDDDGVYYDARCECGTVATVECFSGAGIPQVGFVAATLLTALHGR